MQQFKPVTKQDGAKLRRYYKTCNYGLCEYSLGTKLMWKKSASSRLGGDCGLSCGPEPG